MDPSLLSFLVGQQMATQQLGFPMLQAGAVPMTIQAPSLHTPSAPQLLGMDQYFKAATLPATINQDLLLQLLNNNTLGAMAPQMTTILNPPLQAKQQQQPQPLTALFQQLVAAQQAQQAALQPPLFVDHASAFAALRVQQSPPHQQQPLTTASSPTAFSPFLLTPTVVSTPPTPVVTVLPTQQQQRMSVCVQQPPTVRPKPKATVAPPAPTVVLQPKPRRVQQPAAIPVITLDATPEKAPVTSSTFRVVAQLTPPATAPTTTSTITSGPGYVILRQSPPQAKPEVPTPVKTSPVRSSSTTPVWDSSQYAASGSALLPPPAAAVASTSKSSSVDEEVESMMSGEEEDKAYLRPEDAFAGRQRRADHIAFHRKMKSLLKSLKGSDLVCKLCAVKVDRHDNAFKTHIAEHATKGASQLECRYCGYETPSRVEMNVHMGEKHPHGSERAYTDKRDHLKMIEIMNQCFAKVPRPMKMPPRLPKDPDAPKQPRGSTKRRLEEEAAAGAADGVVPAAPIDVPKRKYTLSGKPRMSARDRRIAAEQAGAGPEEATVSEKSFEETIVRFCTDKQETEATCGCGDLVPLKPSALLAHVKTLHVQYKCTDCGDILDTPESGRQHTVKMHGGEASSYAERLANQVTLKSIQQRFLVCFMGNGQPVAKSHLVHVLREIEKRKEEEDALRLKTIKQEPIDIKEEPMEIKKEPMEIKDEPMEVKEEPI